MRIMSIVTVRKLRCVVLRAHQEQPTRPEYVSYRTNTKEKSMTSTQILRSADSRDPLDD